MATFNTNNHLESNSQNNSQNNLVDDFKNDLLDKSEQKARILITGAGGQIGQILSKTLSQQKNVAAVFASDIQTSTHTPYFLDVCDEEALEDFIETHQITEIYHLAAILSATGEKNPMRTWQINMQGLLNILEIARNKPAQIDKIFFPSTIAVFGEHFDKNNTKNDAPLFPSTVYGISKASGENWCAYYRQKYGVDVRSIRYPGVIGWQTQAGGGTTDYAIEIFHELIKNQTYTCFLSSERCLPMMYMDDAIAATLQIMQAPKESIKLDIAYNIAACSFTPKALFAEIENQLKKSSADINYSMIYAPDFRDQIAANWPYIIDDTPARLDWGWQAKFGLEEIVADMLKNIIQNQ